MIRNLLLLALVVWASPARAQGEAAAGDDRRYQFNQVEGGALRLDTRSGQVSLCSRRSAGWACTLVADDRAALDAEIGRLQAENGRLKQALLDRGTPPAADTAPPASKDRDEAAPPLPRGGDIDRVMATIERVWRRLVEMIVNLQKDMNRS